MSMTTELAQRMKVAALKAKQANDLYLEGKITLSECVVETKDHLDYSDNPNNTLALVEALEAKDKRNAELECITGALRAIRPGHITIAGEKIGIYMRDEVDAALAAGVAVEGESS